MSSPIISKLAKQPQMSTITYNVDDIIAVTRLLSDDAPAYVRFVGSVRMASMAHSVSGKESLRQVFCFVLLFCFVFGFGFFLFFSFLFLSFTVSPLSFPPDLGSKLSLTIPEKHRHLPGPLPLLPLRCLFGSNGGSNPLVSCRRNKRKELTSRH